MNRNSKTGVTTYYNMLFQGLVENGFQPILITPDNAPRIIRKICKGILVLKYFMIIQIGKFVIDQFCYFLLIYTAVRKSINKSAVSLIHGQDVLSTIAASRALGTPVPKITTCHFNDTPVEEAKLKYSLGVNSGRWLTKWYKDLFKTVDQFIFLSRYSLNRSCYLLPQTADTIVIHNGSTFTPPPKLFRAQPLNIVNIGTIEVRKNQIALIKSCEFLLLKGFKFHITFYGEGPEYNSLRQFVNSKGWDLYITFCSFERRVTEFLPRFDLYVHTALNENCSFAILEAMAAGIPVLAYNTGGTSELYPACKTGLVSSDISSSELAEHIVRFADVGYRTQVRDLQYTNGLGKFAGEAVVQRIIEVYENVACPKLVLT